MRNVLEHRELQTQLREVNYVQARSDVPRDGLGNLFSDDRLESIVVSSGLDCSCEPFRTRTESIPLYVCFRLSSSSSMCCRTHIRSALLDSSQSIWLKLGCKLHLMRCVRRTISSTLTPHCLNVATSKASLTLRGCQRRGLFRIQNARPF